MIDWLTITCSSEDIPDYSELVLKLPKVMCVNSDGSIEWEKAIHKRSDDHRLCVRIESGGLSVFGSPAWLYANDNVFGGSNCHSDVVLLAKAMISYASDILDIDLPTYDLFSCKRLDVTYNYYCKDEYTVNAALEQLGQYTGRYKTTRYPSTVNFGQGSQLRMGKAYAKGPHLLRLVNKGVAQVSDSDLLASRSLLRLELSLRSQFWRERSALKWFEYKEDILLTTSNEYWGQIFGENREIRVLDYDILKACLNVTDTESQAKAAFRTFGLIKMLGQDTAKNSMSKATFYRHRKILLNAGLTPLDLGGASKVVKFPARRVVLGSPVSSWSELRRLVA